MPSCLRYISFGTPFSTSKVEAFKMVREVAKSDSLFILPDEIQEVLKNIDAKKPVDFSRKSWA